MKTLPPSAAGFQIRQSNGDLEAQPRNIITEVGTTKFKEPREQWEASSLRCLLISCVQFVKRGQVDPVHRKSQTCQAAFDCVQHMSR